MAESVKAETDYLDEIKVPKPLYNYIGSIRELEPCCGFYVIVF
jgi:hypothetical protein